MIADSTTLPIAQCSLLHTFYFFIPNVAYISELSMNLISVSQLVARGYRVIFYASAYHVQDRYTLILIGVSCRLSGVYVHDNLRFPHLSTVASASCFSSISFP